ncbi:MAG: hypothetical protein ACUVWR_12675 [Anaerolineae bacterium]
MRSFPGQLTHIISQFSHSRQEIVPGSLGASLYLLGAAVEAAVVAVASAACVGASVATVVGGAAVGADVGTGVARHAAKVDIDVARATTPRAILPPN